MTRLVTVDVADRIATVRLNRPPVNAMNTLLCQQLGTIIAELESDELVRALIITGGDTTFAAGADITELVDMTYEQIAVWNRGLQRVFNRVATLPIPVIAAVNGYALGGGLELALAADFRILGDTASIALPEIKLGIVPGAGGMQRLHRLIGAAKAKEILMSGRRLNAAEAGALGLAERVVPAGDVLACAQELAAGFVNGPRFALQAIKEAIDLGADSSLEAGLAMDRNLLAGLFGTEDRRIGIASFLQHGLGKARFSGGPE